MVAGLAVDAEREVGLPMAPFVGPRVYGAEWAPKGCDPSEDEIEEVAYDLPTGKVLCYLRLDDFCPASVGTGRTDRSG